MFTNAISAKPVREYHKLKVLKQRKIRLIAMDEEIKFEKKQIFVWAMDSKKCSYTWLMRVST